MTEQATEYICLGCGGPLKFDPESGKMKCEYCGSIYTIEEAKKYYEEKNKSVAAAPIESEDESYWTDGDESMKSYKCNSCGAEMVCDETTAATSCPYCGNPAVMPQQFKGMMRPKYVIPFKVDKSEVKGKLANYYKGKKLLPGSFKGHNHIDEIKGVYVPFWLYSGTVDADLHFEAEQVEEKKTATEKITITKHYDVHRKGTVKFDKIPTDASSAMPDDLMDSIEPYDYKDLTKFEMEYLPGYIADKYDVSKEDTIERARKRAEATTISEITETVTGYDNVDEKVMLRHIRYAGEKQEYAMLPVWLLSTKWNNQNFLFAVNGQTGKMIGNLPIDRMKQLIWFVCSFLISFGIMAALIQPSAGMEWAISVGVGFIVAFIVNLILTGSMKPVHKGDQAAGYLLNDKKPVNLSIKTDNYVRTTEKREKIEKNN